jgi:hypothetical protein
MLEVPAKVRFFPVEGAILVLADGYPPQADGATLGTPLGVLEGDTLTFPPRLAVPGFMSLIVSVEGKWPSALDLLATGTTGRTGIAEHWSLGAKAWELKKSAESSLYVGLANTGTSLLALRIPALAFPGTRSDVVALRGSLAGVKLSPIDPACTKGLSADDVAMLPPTDLQPQLFGSTGAGTLFALGTRCNEKSAIETWAAGTKGSKVVETKATGFESVRISTARGRDEAWVFSSPVLRYDGASWSVFEERALTAGALAVDGTLWAIDDQAKLWRGKPGAFEEIPVGAPVDDVAIASDGTVWIAAGGALHRTKREGDTAKDVKVASTSPPPAGKLGKAPPKPGGPKCKTNVVVLYGFTKTTPDDYDFPLSRKALKGHTELETTRFVVRRRQEARRDHREGGEGIEAPGRLRAAGDPPRALDRSEDG